MWQSLPFLEAMRSRIEITAATLTIIAAVLILLTRWPIARRISSLQAKEKEILQSKLASSLESTSRLQQELDESSRRHEAKENELLEQIRVATNQSRDASAKAKELAEIAAPRTLSAVQKADLRALLMPCAGQAVLFEVPLGSPEAIGYAKEIADVFTGAGWVVKDTLQAVYAGTPKGIILKISSQENPHPCALRVQQAFRDIGIDAPGNIHPDEKADLLRIIIGHKPS